MYTENEGVGTWSGYNLYSFNNDDGEYLPLNNLQALSGGPKLSVTGEMLQGNLNAIPVVSGLSHDYSFRESYMTKMTPYTLSYLTLLKVLPKDN